MNGKFKSISSEVFLNFNYSRNVDAIPKYTNINYQSNLGRADDQGLCACCYGHASTALITNFLYKKTGKIYSLSTQQFVDCSTRPEYPELSNMGCKYGHYEECAIYLNVSINFLLFQIKVYLVCF